MHSSSVRCVNIIYFLLVYLLGNQGLVYGPGTVDSPQVHLVSCRGPEILEEHNEMDQTPAR